MPRKGLNDVMNCRTAITFTYFTDIDSIDDIVINTITQLKNLNYTIEKLTIGHHTDATREHYHLCVVLSYSGKYLKHFNRSLTTKLKDLPKDKKISFYHQDQKDYNELKGLMYPLKETEHEEENRELFSRYTIGLTIEEWEKLLIEAQQLYSEVVKKREDKEAEKEDKQNAVKLKYQILDDAINELQFANFRYDYNTTRKIRFCIQHLLKHARNEYIENDKHTFKIQSMMDLAISYLYNKQHITEDDIIDLKFQFLKMDF